MAQLLEASNLSFSYGVRPVLREVGISMSSGEVVALLGPNGSGKTTLLRALLGHLHAAGSINWDRRALSSWTRRELARHVAYLPQTPTFDAGQTVLDVLRLGRAAYWTAFGIESPRDAEVVESNAKLLELTDLLGRSMDELSGGQRQRVFVGRCLVQEPAAMLLDEPSTFLDLRHQVELCDLLRRLSREKQIGVLMASHDLNLAAGYSDRLMLLHDGAIVASGSPSDVLQPELLSRVYGIDIQRIESPGNIPVVIARPQPTP
ncbi:MAG TPA: ABC transporter ATP-binding protein [Tepidisphaeraceae bacterium]|nr:ABC transporter ATP-binding protein [Tepidisphaeraceae bacterium]